MKISKFIIALIAASTLAGCDLPGFGGDEGEVDATLYELKLTTNLEKAEGGIRAQLRGERDSDEIEALKEAGATQEDIDKAGTCVEGTYYFFDQDPVYLYEPFIPGYEFLGWYKGSEFLGYMDTNYDGTPEYIWNMDNKKTTLEARFKLLKFDIVYMDEGTSVIDSRGNPSTWSIEDGEVELKPGADRSSEGLQFEGWSFTMGGDTRYDGYVTKLNEQFLIESNVAHISMEGKESQTFALHEIYSEIKHNVKLTFDTDIIEAARIEITPPGETTYCIYDDGNVWVHSGLVETELKHNTVVVVYPSLALEADLAGYVIDGIYYGNYKISEEVSGGGFKITATQDADVELRAKLPE